MRSPVLAALALLLIAGCSSGDSRPPATELVGTATISPASARVGETITLTPAGEVSGYCDGTVTVYRTSAAKVDTVGLLRPDGTFQAADGDTPVTVQGCPGATAASSSYVIPADLTPGSYTLCRTFGTFAPGCGVVLVTA